jgi:hypothetical protein
MLQTIQDINTTSVSAPEASYSAPFQFNMEIYPNPTNAASRLHFTVPGRGVNILSLYDISGSLIKTSILGIQPLGSRLSHRLELSGLASGIYLVSLRNGVLRESKKLVIIR